MKKVTFFMAALVAAIICSSLASSVAFADCGKMMIYRHRWRQLPPPPSKNVIVITINQDARPYSSTDIRIKIENNPKLPPAPSRFVPYNCPPPFEAPQTYPRQDDPAPRVTQQVDGGGSMGGNNHSPGITNNGGVVNFVENNIDRNGVSGYGTFKEVGQRAVIAWNGYEDERGEETLILTTNEVSTTGEDTAMLSVLPLPGAPLDITEADPEIFNKTRDLLYSKLPPDATSGMGRVVFERKIGSHNIFVWKLDDINAFKREVTAYVAKTYNNEAAALIDERTEKIVGEYFKRGYCYFAFDLTLVKGIASDKVAIAYRFQSQGVYFPLQISQVGAKKSNTTVDLIVMSPGKIITTGAVMTDKGSNGASVTGNRSVDFTIDEVKGLNPELAKVFGNRLNTVKVREYMFRGDITSYDGDFTAKNY